jgi:hypothetical protein
MTYSEMRIAYEVTAKKTNWEVVIGMCVHVFAYLVYFYSYRS